MSMSHLDIKWTVAPFSTRRGTKEKNIAIVYRRFDSPPIYRDESYKHCHYFIKSKSQHTSRNYKQQLSSNQQRKKEYY